MTDREQPTKKGGRRIHREKGNRSEAESSRGKSRMGGRDETGERRQRIKESGRGEERRSRGEKGRRGEEADRQRENSAADDEGKWKRPSPRNIGHSAQGSRRSSVAEDSIGNGETISEDWGTFS